MSNEQNDANQTAERPKLERVVDASATPAPAPAAPPPPAPKPAAEAPREQPEPKPEPKPEPESRQDDDSDEESDSGDAPTTDSGPSAPSAQTGSQPSGQNGRQPQQGQGQPGERTGRRRRRRRGRGGRGGAGQGQQPGQPAQPSVEGQPPQPSAEGQTKQDSAPQSGAGRRPPLSDEERQRRREEGLRRREEHRQRQQQRQQQKPQGQQQGERQGERHGDRRRDDAERERRRREEQGPGQAGQGQKPAGGEQQRHRDDRRGEHPRADEAPRADDERRRERHERHSERQRGEHVHHRAEKLRKPVKREILANTSFEETRVAIMEDGRLAELLWERKSEESIVGNIYKGVVENVLPGISSAFVNIGFEKNAYLYISDVLGERGAAIDATLKKGQHIMVQVAKEAIGTKGMKVTMDVSLPGRFLVFTPFQSYVGISKHIEDLAERKRLGEVVDRLVAEILGGKGIVVRTEAEGASAEDLEREVKYLWQTWTSIQKTMAEPASPALLHKDLDVTLQVARDILSEEVYVYLLDNKDAFKRVVEFVDGISPELKERVRLYEARTPIFKAFNLEGHIENLRKSRVPLPNGGSLIIQEAESLCAIDVNTGRFTGSKSQEETVTQTNIEAAVEVAHQLRLRNIGGIIVVDFIDMRKASNRNKVMEAFAQAVKTDRAKIRILPITRLGLIEMTRERKRESTVSLITDECPECKGAGRVLSAETIRIRIQREILELTGGRPNGTCRVHLHPGLADVFRQQQAQLEKNCQRSVKIQSDAALKWEDYKIVLE